MNSLQPSKILSFLLISLCSMGAFSQSVDWLRADENIAFGITYDNLGNSYTISSYASSLTVGGNVYTSNGMADMIVIKHDAAGNVLWATSFGGTDQEYCGDIVFDGYGNVWATGQFSSTFEAGTYTLPTNGGEDAFVVKLDAASGNILFASTGGGAMDEDGGDIEVDGAGNVYVIGDNASSDFDWDGFTTVVDGMFDVFIMKFDNAGVAQDLMTISGSVWEITYAGHVDNAGNVYIGGMTTSTSSDFNGTIVNTGSDNRFVVKFDPAGNHVWSAFGSGGGNINDIAVDQWGNAYITATGANSSWGGITIPSGFGAGDVLVAKVNNDGTFSWAQLWGGTGNDQGNGIDCNAAGDVFVAGEFDALMDFGGYNLTGNGIKGFVAKLDSAGTVQWALGADGSGSPQRFQSVQANALSELWITGFGASYIVLGADSIGMGLGYSAKLLDSANVINGVVYSDVSNDGIKDGGEIGIPNVMLQLNGGNYVSSSNSNGKYHIFTTPGAHSVTLPYVPLYHTLTTATSQTANFTGIGEADTANHFGLYPTPNMNDLRIDITSLTNPKAGHGHGYTITYKNVGTTTLNGTVTLDGPALPFALSNPAPTSQSGQTFTWDVGSLIPGTIGIIHVHFDVPTTAMIDDPVDATATISPFSGDEVIADNTSSVNQLVSGPYDPNYKKVSVDTIYDLSGASYLEYEIHFQNLGNAPSYDVLVIDTLDDTYLEIASMEIVAASHLPMDLTINNGTIAHFFYPNIMLPDSASDPIGSNGFVKFKIKQDGTLPLGSQIENFVDIYFDYNPAVRTDTATTIHLTASGLEEIDINTIALFPNPVISKLNLKLSQMTQIEYVRVVDLSGRLVEMIPLGIESDQYTLNVDDYNAGMYLIEVRTPSGIEVLKFQKN